MLNLEKGAVLNLEKKDGSNISNIRIGLAWDVADTNWTVDLDIFVIRKEDKKVTFFGDKTAIEWVRISDDNTTGEWDGDDEFIKMDAKKTSDWTYIIWANIYNATAKNQTLALVKSAKATIYNDEDNSIIAEFKLTENGWDNTWILVAEIVDSWNNYELKTLWTFVKWDINQIVSSL